FRVPRPYRCSSPAPLDLLLPPTQDTRGRRQGSRCYSGAAAEPSTPISLQAWPAQQFVCSSATAETPSVPSHASPTRAVCASEMAGASFFDRMVSQLRSTSKYYTGYPKDLGPSRIIPFTSERQFVQLLHEGRPVVVAFTIKCTYTQHLDKVLEEAAATFYPHIKFVRVECPKYPGFCLTRQKTEYPFLEVFYNPEQAANPGKIVDPSITKYSAKVLPVSNALPEASFQNTHA
uniref:Thioredoxin domain-containing protein n=1 Tax=Aegilops tauschii subsp. strangulata TaxID=200361 RepID=A0A452ZTN6_AEGTS